MKRQYVLVCYADEIQERLYDYIESGWYITHIFPLTNSKVLALLEIETEMVEVKIDEVL